MAGPTMGAGDEEDRGVLGLGRPPDVLGQGEPAAVGQVGVDNHRVGRLDQHAALGPADLGLGGEGIVRFGEGIPDATLHFGVTFDHEHVGRHGRRIVYRIC